MGSNIALFDPVRSIAFGSILGTFVPFGFSTTPTIAAPLGHPTRILHFINDTNGSYMLSTDGVTDMVPLIGDSFNLYDLTSDEDENETLRMAKGTQIYIRFIVAPSSVAGTSNAVYLACMYGKGE